ncbi:GNAT family N-acetyltransferase [Bacillus cereus]|jgi:GNAT superfamily N-acetyltransferase|uniref:GNAT family N-acetyltransferase n=1 Tax=Bacillus cereus TaxID=1396 RepID=A0A2C1LSU5_BACCE|nr:GNAT family N-acetyltransferase [Bacillus cereus]MDR2993210.1 GNAT family N-acetyltransferase [Bacillus cereus]PFQ38446.1 GNAT family N-acetyltransferase [Bacillus cereus]PGU01012.1 GNAT family N-acetyltransferase [Bacillus cereus]
MITVKNIDGSETYVLRQKILRPNQLLADCKYPSDYEVDTFHLGAFINDELISIASFSKEIYPDLQNGIHYRLRGMATLPSFRNKRAGSSLIQKAERILKERKANILWCNGRITVADYYKRLGFREHGEIFEIEPIGLHKVLYKKI